MAHRLVDQEREHILPRHGLRRTDQKHALPPITWAEHNLSVQWKRHWHQRIDPHRHTIWGCVSTSEMSLATTNRSTQNKTRPLIWGYDYILSSLRSASSLLMSPLNQSGTSPGGGFCRGEPSSAGEYMLNTALLCTAEKAKKPQTTFYRQNIQIVLLPSHCSRPPDC